MATQHQYTAASMNDAREGLAYRMQVQPRKWQVRIARVPVTSYPTYQVEVVNSPDLLKRGWGERVTVVLYPVTRDGQQVGYEASCTGHHCDLYAAGEPCDHMGHVLLAQGVAARPRPAHRTR